MSEILPSVSYLMINVTCYDFGKIMFLSTVSKVWYFGYDFRKIKFLSSVSRVWSEWYVMLHLTISDYILEGCEGLNYISLI